MTTQKKKKGGKKYCSYEVRFFFDASVVFPDIFNEKKRHFLGEKQHTQTKFQPLFDAAENFPTSTRLLIQRYIAIKMREECEITIGRNVIQVWCDSENAYNQPTLNILPIRSCYYETCIRTLQVKDSSQAKQQRNCTKIREKVVRKNNFPYFFLGTLIYPYIVAFYILFSQLWRVIASDIRQVASK